MIKNMIPFFSIIIPVYNVEKYIDRAITSVLGQSFQNFEIIIINDGSIDKTADVIDEYAKRSEKIKVVNHLKNDSQHIARMDGVAISNGQYVVFLDADDFFINDAFAILYDEIQKNPGYDFYEFGYIKQPSHEVVFPSFTGEDRFSAYFTRDKYPEHTMWNKVYDNNLLKKSFAIMEREFINNAEDVYESIVIAFFSKKTMNIKNVIINYTIGTGISTTYKDYNKTIEYLNSLKKTLNLIDIFLKNNNQFINMDNLYHGCLSYAINDFNAQKNIEDKKKLYFMLFNYFDTRIVLEYFLSMEHSLLQSKDYIIGHKILLPLRKIKSLLKVTIHLLCFNLSKMKNLIKYLFQKSVFSS
jgi:glycosyltransferase involved in cell wall biosynthesis